MLALAAALAATLTVDLSPRGTTNVIRPAQALGAGIDGSWAGGSDTLLTARNIAAMRSAGLPALTYRLRTELGIEAWHWNPAGAWSDPARAQGYWTSSDRLGAPIQLSWGYKLPRRGDTVDNANNTGWSMLDDGNPATFWKSNPYLAGRPQWLVIELGDSQVVDAAEIDWALPYAVRYRVQYWVGRDEYDPAGRWVTFPRGAVTAGHGGLARLDLGASAPTAFVRVLMEASSGTAPAGSTDARDRAGYAVGEVRFGRRGADGVLHDAVVHAAKHDGQSVAHVSSTDPWHRATDRDPDLEQPGLDRVLAGPLAGGRPALVPVSVLYGTPEDAAAEVRYLTRRGYPLSGVELGEEPDGQSGDGEDYAALYVRWAKALRAAAPGVKLGGPSLQSMVTDVWLRPGTDRSWNSHFIKGLKAQGRLADLQFFSFERYPFDDICGDIRGKLIEQSKMLAGGFTRLKAEGVPTTIPWMISEYGFSAFSGRAEADLPSALLMADMVGDFLSRGGDVAYLFGYGPNEPVNQHLPCAGYGNLMLHLADADGQASTPMPSYWTARMLSSDWLVAGDAAHRLQATKVAGAGGAVTAFAALRPDGRLGVLMVNRGSEAVRLTGPVLRGAAEVTRYSRRQYAWVDDGAKSHPARSEPPARATEHLDGFELEPDSVTVAVVRARPVR